MATLEQIESALMRADAAGDADAARILAAEVRRMRSAQNSPVTGGRPLTAAQQPEKSASLGDRVGNLWAGVKNALAAPLVGGAQRLGLEGAQNTADAWAEDAAAIGKRPGGLGGQVIGGTALVAPTAMLPGANTIAGGAILGGLTGAVQPTTEGESALWNTALGAGMGGAIPAGIRAARTGRALLVDPFTDAGRTRIAGKTIYRAAGEGAPRLPAALSGARGNTPGFQPSTAQAARNDGVSALDRTMRAIDPAAYGALDQEQRSALATALQSVAQTPEARAAQVAAREAAVNPLYNAAKRKSAMGDSVFDGLLTRPSMKEAVNRAGRLSAERGQPFDFQQAQQSPIVGPSGAPIPKPAAYSGRALHDVKMGLDDAIGTPAMGMQGAERTAAIGTKDDFLQWLESKIPEYRTARETYAEQSKPISQMDIGQELYRRFVPALADQGNTPFRMNAQSYANALRNGDKVAQNVTGMKNAKLEAIMTPEQMALLQGVAKDAEAKAASEVAGRGAGSDTVQKLAMSNLASEAGIPTFVQNLASVPGGWLKRGADLLYKSADDDIRKKLAFLLTNPQEAAAAMRGAVPGQQSQLGQFLRQATQGAALSAPTAYTAIARE